MHTYTKIPHTALAIFAHPDDAEIACGGTLARWAAERCHVILAVATQGDKGGDGGDPGRLSEERTRELLEAGRLLGVNDVIQLAYLDGELENSLELRRRLVTLIRSFRPEVVLTGDPTAVFFGDLYYNHRDHRQLGWAVLDAVFPAARQRAYFPEAGDPVEELEVLLAASLEPNTSVSIDGLVEKKVAAMRAHRAQLARYQDALDRVVAERARQAARQAGFSGEAELFRMVRGGA
ncbi:MAG: PIG-L deacetylase family protein [Ferrimicrobium sp.]|uniref:PIG-L deacetylase family protein n=1 Tax=Ferrimicrobium sp. TaxID=2926050 RepID=UPI00260F0172|nr:PIG-L deacetylase family protein [Ferrimicrobium sp.]